MLSLLDPTEGGVRFSLLDMSISLFLAKLFDADCVARSLRGTERSEYILVVEAVLFDLSEGARLSGGDLDWRDDLELLWLNRRVLTMYGNRSFIRAVTGVPTEGCDADDP